MRVYLDACALNRLSDDQGQPRVFAEARAVEQILRMVVEGRAEWLVSTALLRELGRNPDHEKRHDISPSSHTQGRCWNRLRPSSSERTASRAMAMGCTTRCILHSQKRTPMS